MASRLITDEASKSDKLPQLSPDALSLFFLMIPHLSVHGKMPGDPHYVKGIVVPKFKRFTPEKIRKYLKEISGITSVKWFQANGLWYIHSLNFSEHQPGLRTDRAGKDTLPDFPGKNSQAPDIAQLRDNSGSTPGELQPRKYEVEVEVEGEEKHIACEEKKPLFEKQKISIGSLEQKQTFGEFWDALPERNGKKLGQQETYRRFCLLSPDKWPLLIQAAKNYAASQQVKDGVGIRDPKNFIGNDFSEQPWKDWIEPEKKQEVDTDARFDFLKRDKKTGGDVKGKPDIRGDP